MLVQHNTTTNQQSRGTSLSIKIIANSLCNFILVDCYIVQGCASKMRTLNCKFPDNDGAVGFILNPL
jgi:hypothetical protein